VGSSGAAEAADSWVVIMGGIIATVARAFAACVERSAVPDAIGSGTVRNFWKSVLARSDSAVPVCPCIF